MKGMRNMIRSEGDNRADALEKENRILKDLLARYLLQEDRMATKEIVDRRIEYLLRYTK